MTNKTISALTAATVPLAGTEFVPIWDGATKKVTINDLSVRNYRANATTGVMQITGPAAAAIRIMTVPDADWTAARTDTGQTFTGLNTFTYSAAGYSLSVTNTQGAATGNGLYVQTRWDVAANIVAKFATNSGATDVLTLYGDGRTVFSTGNLVQGTAAKGINFTANTPATGMTSQLLNWYEEGTWSPTLTPAGGSITLNSTLTKGLYTRIGRQVTHTGLIYVTSVSSPTGALTIGGFPFTSAADYGGRSAGSVSATTLVVGSVSPLMLTISGSSVIAQLDKFVAGSRAVMSADVQADSAFNICLTYMI